MDEAATITVAVERAMHDALADMAQRLFDVHGVQVLSVNFDWISFGKVSGVDRATVTKVRADSVTTWSGNAR